MLDFPVQIFALIPMDAQVGEMDLMTVTAASGWDPTVTAQAQVTTTAIPNGGIIHRPGVHR